MKRCDYCGQKSEGVQCPFCLSTDFNSESVSQIIEGHPYHYKGYVVWQLVDYRYYTVEYLFYLGDTLVERLVISREVLRTFVPEGESGMPFIWDLFLVAQGEEEVLQVVEQNTPKFRAFKITLEPAPREEYAEGLTERALYEAIAQGERRFV